MRSAYELGKQNTTAQFTIKTRSYKKLIQIITLALLRLSSLAGYDVTTLTDCVAATSIEAQDATIEHNFGMFSNPMSSSEFIETMKFPQIA